MSEFKPGDRVKIYSPSNQLLMYEGLQAGATGTVRRLIAGMVRVEIDGTGSQDSEGHNAYSDFLPSELTKIPAYGSENTNVSRGPVSEYNAFNPPTPTEKPQGAAAVPRVWIEPGTVEGCVEWCRAMKVKTHQSQIEFCSVAEKDAAVKAARNEGFQAAATLCEEEGPEALWEEAAREKTV